MRVVPGLSLTGRSSLAARSLSETLNEAAKTAVAVSNWELDQEAWNLPRVQSGTVAEEADQDAVDVREGDTKLRESDLPALPPESTL
jgi:hypothetical protein